MTCKDCIHYDVCENYLNYLDKTIQGKAGFLKIHKKKCPYQKDKTKYIELPCKVGDTVYYIEDHNNERKIITLCCSMIFMRGDGNYVQLIFPNNRTSKSFNFINFGRCLFLTKAEAEAKLKELLNDN